MPSIKYCRLVEQTTSSSPSKAKGPQVHASCSSPKTKKHDQKPTPDEEQATSMVNEEVNEQGTINMFYSNMRMGVNQNPINSDRLSSENIEHTSYFALHRDPPPPNFLSHLTHSRDLLL